MRQPLRAGIVGAGFMAKVHSRAVRNAGRLVVGITSSSIESASRFANEFGPVTVYETWQDLVSSPDIDVVHICTPNELHAEIAIAAAEANKQIICEKPISVSVEEAKAIRDAVSASGSGFAVPFAYRFYPVVRELRARIQNDEAGAVHLIHGNYLQDWLADSNDTNWRVNNSSGGFSRAFADVGTHWCDLMEFVSGDRIARLIAHTSKAFDKRGGQEVNTEDVAIILFETESGASGSLTVSQVSLGRKNQLLIELDGAKASYTFNQENPDSLFVGGRTGNQIIMHGLETMKYPDARRLSVVPSGHPQGYQDAFNAFISDAYDGFQGKYRDGVPDLAAGIRATYLISAVLVSAAEKRWVEVSQMGSLQQSALLAS